MAVFYPKPDEFAALYNELIELGASPKEIKTTSDGPVPLGLEVSDDLFQRYLDSHKQPDAPKKRTTAKKESTP